MRLFIAGATGAIGVELVRLAAAKGHSVHALSHSTDRVHRLTGLADQVDVCDAVAGVPALTGADVVVSALGAPVTMHSRERRGYRDVDIVANTRILDAARHAGVWRFLYVSLHVESGYSRTAYVEAHEAFVDHLRRSGLSYTVVRPTGVFTALTDLVDLARRGFSPVVGDGLARTNPVHPADVAEALWAQIDDGPVDVEVGGPETFTRREIAALAFHVLGKTPRLLSVPPALFRIVARATRVANPRLGELLEFAAAVSITDCVAPAVGRRRLEDYFRAVAGSEQAPLRAVTL